MSNFLYDQVNQYINREHGGVWAEFSRKSGISASTLHSLKNGKSTSEKTIRRISDATGMSFDTLMAGSGQTTGIQAEDMCINEPGVVYNAQAGETGTAVPLYDAVTAGAFDHFRLPTAWLQQILGGSPPYQAAFMTAVGNLMAPAIQDGDLLLLDTQGGIVVGDGVYVFDMNGTLVLRRIQVMLDGSISVWNDHSGNRTEIAQRDSVRPFGRVVWIGRKV